MTPPAEGLSWEQLSETTGRWVFWCDCSRRQGWAPEHEGGGVTVSEAEHFGWRLVKGKWVCPFCSGNLGNLKKLIMEHKAEDVEWEE